MGRGVELMGAQRREEENSTGTTRLSSGGNTCWGSSGDVGGLVCEGMAGGGVFVLRLQTFTKRVPIKSERRSIYHPPPSPVTDTPARLAPPAPSAASLWAASPRAPASDRLFCIAEPWADQGQGVAPAATLVLMFRLHMPSRVKSFARG